MMKARSITYAAGQEYVVFAADQQLFKVAAHIIWENPQNYGDIILRLGGMHFIMNIIGCIGTLALDSGLFNILSSAFAGVEKMMQGKKYPQNFRALVLLTEELLQPILHPDSSQGLIISSMGELQRHLDDLGTRSRTAKFWIDVVIRPILLCMKYTRAEREGNVIFLIVANSIIICNIFDLV